MTIAVAIAALLGLIDSLYLLWKRYAKPHSPLICPIGENCQAVLDSRYGSLLGFRNEFLGVAYYLTLLALLGFAGQAPTLKILVWGQGIDPLVLATVLSGVAGMASAMLTAIQTFTLKNYCSYCLFANVLNAFIFIALLSR